MESKSKWARMFVFKTALNNGGLRVVSQALGFIFLASAMVSCSSGTTQQATAIDSLVNTRENLKTQLNAAHLEIDGLTSKNVGLDTQIQRLDSVIEKKDARISVLEGRVSYLEKNTKTLNGKLKSDQQIKSENMALKSQKDSLAAKYVDLKIISSVLHASNIRIEAVHMKHNGRMKNTTFAERTDKLRLYFDIDKNRIAEDGLKKLYIVIKDPDGDLLSNPDYGSGVTTNYKGKPLHYSLLKEISLKQNESVYDVSDDWKQDYEYKSGIYKIAIYNGGYRIGSGEVTLN